MRGYVGVRFSNADPVVYTYMIPDNINPTDIDGYVVVDDIFYNRATDYPYEVVRVEWIDTENPHMTDGAKPTKYIKGYIDTKQPKAEKKWPLVDILWNMLTIEEKTNIIKSYLDIEYVK